MSKEQYVNDAADEIDSKIGFVYETRVDTSDTSTVVKPVRLLLKRLNVFLASGRLLMAAAAAKEETQVHAYALSLVREAEATLEMIAKGQLPLDGALKVDAGTTENLTGPMQYNKDTESNVDAFYDRIANPRYWYPYPNEYGVRIFPYPQTDPPFGNKSMVR
jgi:hypothetical protein